MAFPAEIHVTTMGGKNSGFFLDTVSVIDYTMHSSFQPKHIDFNPFDLAILKLQSCVADYEEANGILKPCQGDGEGKTCKSSLDKFSFFERKIFPQNQK